MGDKLITFNPSVLYYCADRGVLGEPLIKLP